MRSKGKPLTVSLGLAVLRLSKRERERLRARLRKMRRKRIELRLRREQQEKKAVVKEVLENVTVQSILDAVSTIVPSQLVKALHDDFRVRNVAAQVRQAICETAKRTLEPPVVEDTGAKYRHILSDHMAGVAGLSDKVLGMVYRVDIGDGHMSLLTSSANAKSYVVSAAEGMFDTFGDFASRVDRSAAEGMTAFGEARPGPIPSWEPPFKLTAERLQGAKQFVGAMYTRMRTVNGSGTLEPVLVQLVSLFIYEEDPVSKTLRNISSDRISDKVGDETLGHIAVFIELIVSETPTMIMLNQLNIAFAVAEFKAGSAEMPNSKRLLWANKCEETRVHMFPPPGEDCFSNVHADDRAAVERWVEELDRQVGGEPKSCVYRRCVGEGTPRPSWFYRIAVGQIVSATKEGNKQLLCIESSGDAKVHQLQFEERTHDVKNLLLPVTGCLAVLREKQEGLLESRRCGPAAELPQAVDTVVSDSTLLMDKVDALLNVNQAYVSVSLIGPNKMVADITCSLRVLLKRIVEPYETLMKVDLTFDDNLPNFVRCKVILLDRIVNNFLTNTIRHGQGGLIAHTGAHSSCTIQVGFEVAGGTAGGTEGEAGTVTVMLCDDGPGYQKAFVKALNETAMEPTSLILSPTGSAHHGIMQMCCDMAFWPGAKLQALLENPVYDTGAVLEVKFPSVFSAEHIDTRVPWTLRTLLDHDGALTPELQAALDSDTLNIVLVDDENIALMVCVKRVESTLKKLDITKPSVTSFSSPKAALRHVRTLKQTKPSSTVLLLFTDMKMSPEEFDGDVLARRCEQVFPDGCVNILLSAAMPDIGSGFAAGGPQTFVTDRKQSAAHPSGNAIRDTFDMTCVKPITMDDVITALTICGNKMRATAPFPPTAVPRSCDPL